MRPIKIKLLWFLLWGLQSNLKIEKRRNREIKAQKPNLSNVRSRVAQVEILKRIAKSIAANVLNLVETKGKKSINKQKLVQPSK